MTESDTHWFIYYMFYHPRDSVVSSWDACWEWCDSTHENDAEAALVVVKKDGSYYGRYEGMITEHHGDLLSFTAFPSYSPIYGLWGTTSLRVDPWNISERLRPCSYQEPAGHGMRARGVREDIDLNGEQDSIVYIPSWGVAEIPPNQISGSNSIPIRYALIPLVGLWYDRHNPAIFTEGGSFRGDCSGMDSFSREYCEKNAANPVWKWGDNFAFDPAKYLNDDFCFAQSDSFFSSNY